MSRHRALVLGLGCAGAVALAAPTVLQIDKRLVFNTTASAPIGFYWLETRAPVVGDLVVVRPPPVLAEWMARRGYLPRNIPLMKVLVATAGTSVCAVDGRILVGGKVMASARRRDHWGRSLAPWSGCRTLRPGEVFLLNAAAPASLDGRYFGPLRQTDIVGPVRVLWTWTS